MRFAIAALPHTFPLVEDPAALDAARHWTSEDAQSELLASLGAEFDGFAVAVRFRDSVENAALWADDRAVLWTSVYPAVRPRTDAYRVTEAVIVRSPRLPLYAAAAAVPDGGTLRRGQTVKPEGWTRWVLAHLGAIPGDDTVVDYFTRQPVPAFTTMLTLEGTPA